jgi:excisionase family DNA binding protein
VAQRIPLYVRLPSTAAEKLDRAAFALRTSKQDLVTGLVSRYVDPDTPSGLRVLERIGVGGTRRVVVEAADDTLTVGHHSFVPAQGGEVLTSAEVADLLRTDAETVERMAAAGELPARRLGDEWRFNRDAVLRWLGAPDEEG